MKIYPHWWIDDGHWELDCRSWKTKNVNCYDIDDEIIAKYKQATEECMAATKALSEAIENTMPLSTEKEKR